MTKAMLINYIVSQSLGMGFDPSVALTVCKIESNFDHKAIGPKGELGPFQLRPSSFPQYNKKDLQNTKLNVRIAIRYLKEVKAKCVHKKGLDWLTCYNYGFENAKSVKHPSLFPYVRKARVIRKEFIAYKEVQ